MKNSTNVLITMAGSTLCVIAAFIFYIGSDFNLVIKPRLIVTNLRTLQTDCVSEGEAKGCFEVDYDLMGLTPAFRVQQDLFTSLDKPARGPYGKRLNYEFPAMSSGKHQWNALIKGNVSDASARYVYGTTYYDDLWGFHHQTTYCFYRPNLESMFDSCANGNFLE